MINEQTLDDQAWDQDVKGRERLFVLHYCTSETTRFNATASYKAAYTKIDRNTGKEIVPDQATCESCASRLMKRERVKLAVKMLLKTVQADIDEENVYRMLRELWNLSTYNPADILDKNGKLKVKKLSDLGEKAKCIAQITPTMYGVKYTLYDRNKALHELLNYLNIIRPEQQQDIQLNVVEMVKKAVSPEAWNAAMEAAEQKQEGK
ncbi:MAG: terminase small subunit [Treponema sp.]|nr:terminase small subunit [Treponema sp.]